MPARVRCPTCETALTAPDELLGQTVRCEECGQTFVARAVRRPATELFDDRPPRRYADDSGEFARPRPRRRHRTGVAAFAIAAVAMLFVTAAVGGALYWATSRSRPAPPPMAVAMPAAPGMGLAAPIAPARGQRVTLSNPRRGAAPGEYLVDYAFVGGRPLGGVWFAVAVRLPNGDLVRMPQHLIMNNVGTFNFLAGGIGGPVEVWVEESDRPFIGPQLRAPAKASNSVVLN